MDVGCDDKTRFAVELEFVQCLANPHYLNWLGQNAYFDDPAFVNYLAYLRYWKQPDYARWLKFPHCLFFLDLLQSETFRKAVAVQQAAEEVHSQTFYYWAHYRSNATRASNQAAVAAAAATATVCAGVAAVGAGAGQRRHPTTGELQAGQQGM